MVLEIYLDTAHDGSSRMGRV